MKKSMYCALLIIIFLLSAFFLVSCQKTEPEPENIANAVTIVDMAGDTVVLPKQINRVVSTSDPCTDMMIAFGQGDKLIGAYFRALDNPWL